jgi:hypothetical protein
MRRESCEGIRQLVARHAVLTDLFPKLLRAVDSGHVLGWGWAQLSDRVDAYVKALDTGEAER